MLTGGINGAIAVGVGGGVATHHLRGLLDSSFREGTKPSDNVCGPPAPAGVWDRE